MAIVPLVVPGSRVRWRRADGRMVHVLVDLVHDSEDERWLFSTIGDTGQFVAVNSRVVLSVERGET